jgi:hypothetical protein
MLLGITSPSMPSAAYEFRVDRDIVAGCPPARILSTARFSVGTIAARHMRHSCEAASARVSTVGLVCTLHQLTPLSRKPTPTGACYEFRTHGERSLRSVPSMRPIVAARSPTYDVSTDIPVYAPAPRVDMPHLVTFLQKRIALLEYHDCGSDYRYSHGCSVCVVSNIKACGHMKARQSPAIIADLSKPNKPMRHG